MKYRSLLFCVLMIFLLSGCGQGTQTLTPEELQTQFAAADSFSSRVAIHVELPERSTDYVIDWVYQSGRSIMTVAEPAEIAGITVESDDQGLSFRYQDAILVVDAAGNGVSPLEILPELCFGWSGGLVKDSCREEWRETETLAVTYAHTRGEKACTQRAWFDPARKTPLYAEFYQGEALALTCEFLTFELPG